MRKRDLIILFSAMALALAVAFTVFSGSVLETGSWGLSFRQSGTPPLGNAGADQLRQYDAAYIGDTTQPRIYLTFDAGYENGCTAKILDVLKFPRLFSWWATTSKRTRTWSGGWQRRATL